MPSYPTYYPVMNNGYAQQSAQNPYQPRMDFLQSYQQSLQQPVQQIPQINNQMNIIGKIVDSVEMVKSMDIPMDGMLYYFPKADGTEIYGKQWLPNGQTRILTFKPLSDENPNTTIHADEKLKCDLSDASTTAFMERFDSLERQINEFMTKSMTKPINSRTKKEIEAE